MTRYWKTGTIDYKKIPELRRSTWSSTGAHREQETRITLVA